jgi:hypothetical protein
MELYCMHKYYTKLPSGYIFKVCMKCKLISCLDLGPLPMTPHCIYTTFAKSRKGSVRHFWPQAFWIRDIEPVKPH